tara:strand:+ start:32 stop:454 length:423 start_codon:yes stop_codon:yes gene_type:complete
MSHPHSGPEYYTLSNYDTCNGEFTQLGIFENLAAVAARLQVIHASCGDEFRIECFHLQTQELCEKDAADVLETRNKYKEENKKKEELYQEYLNKGKEELYESNQEYLDRNKRSEEKAIQKDIKLDKRHVRLDALDDEWET